LSGSLASTAIVWNGIYLFLKRILSIKNPELSIKNYVSYSLKPLYKPTNKLKLK